MAIMEDWFRQRYEDPAQSTPYASEEGGYQWIWGGPYNAEEVLKEEFSATYSEEAIERLADKLTDENFEWAPIATNDEYFENWFDAVTANLSSRATLEAGLMEVSSLLNLEVGNDLIQTLRRLLFANVIAVLETYLSDTFIKRVNDSPELLQKYIDSEPKFKDRKIAFRDVLREVVTVKEEAQKELLDTVWHNLAKIKPLYKEVLRVDLGDIGELSRNVQVRHDIVHRNGKQKDGASVVISREQIEELTKNVRVLVKSVEEQLTAIQFAETGNDPVSI